MPDTLLVAAGGGGDVIGAVMVAQAKGLTPDRALIATVAWERLLIDPVPGPRRPQDFDGLVARDGTFEVLPTTHARAPHGSLLPRLREELGYRLFLLDPHTGADGLAGQLRNLRASLDGTQDVLLVDVGGDVLATGSEPGLRSPLCDALTLAAITQTEPNATVLIAGPGLDGELTLDETDERLRQAGASIDLTLAEVGEVISCVLEWHPTEASALLAAASLGIRGTVEIRDAGTLINLTDEAAEVWSLPAATALADSVGRVVQRTHSLERAATALKRLTTLTELDHEGSKASRSAGKVNRRRDSIDDRVLRDAGLLQQAARDRGSCYTTFRRIAESCHVPHLCEELRGRLVETEPGRLAGPLWRLN